MNEPLFKGIPLERLMIHNWYRYHNQIIDLGIITLLTGATGSGKSVINDAIIYGITSSTNFNQASGNDNSGRRTLFGYIRGLTGKELLRPDGYVTAYIFLEFRNQITKRRFVAGTVIESKNAAITQTSTSKYVIYDEDHDISIDNIDYMDGDTEKFVGDVTVKVGNKISSLKQFKTQNIDTYKEELMRLFGEDFNYSSFQSLTKKSIAYKQDKKLEVSLRDLLFGERQIDVGGCVDQLDAITHFEEVIQANQKKIEYLAPIAKDIEKYNDLKEKARIFDISKIYADICYAKQDLEEKEKQFEKLQNNINKNQLHQKELLGKKNNYEKLHRSLDEQLKDLNSKYGTEQIHLLLDKNKEALKEDEYKASQLEEFITDLKNIKTIDPSINDAVTSFIDSINDATVVDSSYQVLHNVIVDKIKELTDKYDSVRLDKAQQDEKRKSIFLEYEHLKRQKSAISRNVSMFMDELKRKAKNDRKIINPAILADVVDSVDEEWRPWIEAVLGSEREIILCDQRDYHYIKDYMSTSSHKHIRVLNYSAIRTRANQKDGSLAQKIETKHMIARAFLDFKLGNIIICNKEDLEKYPQSISIEGLRYNGYSLYSLKRNEDFYCLGRNALDVKKKKIQDSLRYLINVLEEKKHQEIELKNYLDYLSICNIRDDYANTIIHSIIKRSNTIKEIRNLEEMLITLKNDQNYILIMSKIGEIKENEHILDKEIDNVSYNIRKDQDEINAISADENYVGSIQYFTKILRLEEEKFAGYSIEDQSAAKDLLRTRGKNSFDNRSIQWERDRKELERLGMSIEGQIARYTGKYPEEDHGSGKDSFSYYEERKETLYAENAIELANEIQKHKNMFKDNFKTAIISKLYSNILWAKQFRKEINKTLDKIRFGKDKYKLCVQNTNDEEMKKLLNLITQLGKDFEQNDDFGDLDFSKRKMTDEFCEMLIDGMRSVNKGNQEKAFMRYLDYRNYLEFDVEKNDGISLKDKLGSDSGGEAQTAYYVIIAAAFSNIYNDDSIKLVMIDEAFDKIDENRKSKMLQFFIDLGFQCLITTPTIAPFMNLADTVISVISTDIYTYAKSRKVNNKQKVFAFQKN